MINSYYYPIIRHTRNTTTNAQVFDGFTLLISEKQFIFKRYLNFFSPSRRRCIMESMFNLSGSAILVDFCKVYSNRSSLPFSVILVVGQK